MYLTLDINQMAKPIVSETNNIIFSWIKPLIEKWFSKKLTKRVNSFILKLEGAEKHLDELKIKEAQILLKDTKIIISKIENFDDDLKKDDYLNNHQLKENFKYLILTLYKFESKLHKISYLDTEHLKTPLETKKGILKVNKKNLSNKLSY